MGLISRVSSRTYREPPLATQYHVQLKKMKIPFLSSKWSPKKTPPRRSQSLNNLVNLDPQQRQREFGIEAIDQPTVLRLANGPALKFVEGKWTTDGNPNQDGHDVADAIASAAANTELVTLRSDVKRLTEEQNMLKLKIEILLDMLTEVTGQNTATWTPKWAPWPSRLTALFLQLYFSM